MLASVWMISTILAIIKFQKMMSKFPISPKPVFVIPQRVIQSIMGFLAILNAYTMRISLSIAITELVVRKNHTEGGSTAAVCIADDLDSHQSSGGDYEWSEELQGLILSSFYIGYIVTHIPGGLLAGKFGGKWTLGLGILSTAFFTIIAPVAITQGGVTALIIVRILMGLGEGTTFPALSVLLSQWVPIKERGKLGALVLGGGEVGTILGNMLSGVLLDAYDWPVVFYLFGGLGIMWFIFFCFLCFSDPASHPYIKPSEREYLEREMGTIERNDNLPPIPWKAILTSMPMIALVCAQIGHDWGFYIMVTNLPKYMADVMQFSIKANGLYSSLPYVMMWILSISSGFVGDWLMNKGLLSITNMRKPMTGIVFVIPQRVIQSIMGFLAILNAYTMRISLSIAITELVVRKNHTEGGSTAAVCIADDLDSHQSSGGDYEWSEELQGLILSSFYIGYIVTHIPGGLLAGKFGGKWTLGLGILSTAFFTIIAPVAITQGGVTALIIVRILMGLGEGTTFPALSVLLSQWVPIKERGKLGALVLGGGEVGTILGNMLSGVLLDAYDWPVVFYLFGGLGIMWFIFFCFLCFSDPASHPYIKPSEREYLEREMGTIERNDNLPPIPWKAILTSMPMIALVCAQIGHDWGFYIMVTNLPKYMADVMQFSIKANGLYSSLPYVMMWILSISSGFVGDWLMNKGLLSITNMRKPMTGIELSD